MCPKYRTSLWNSRHFSRGSSSGGPPGVSVGFRGVAGTCGRLRWCHPGRRRWADSISLSQIAGALQSPKGIVLWKPPCSPYRPDVEPPTIVRSSRRASSPCEHIPVRGKQSFLLTSFNFTQKRRASDSSITPCLYTSSNKLVKGSLHGGWRLGRVSPVSIANPIRAPEVIAIWREDVPEFGNKPLKSRFGFASVITPWSCSQVSCVTTEAAVGICSPV
jgi:hypothetical protein